GSDPVDLVTSGQAATLGAKRAGYGRFRDEVKRVSTSSAQRLITVALMTGAVLLGAAGSGMRPSAPFATLIAGAEECPPPADPSQPVECPTPDPMSPPDTSPDTAPPGDVTTTT